MFDSFNSVAVSPSVTVVSASGLSFVVGSFTFLSVETFDLLETVVSEVFFDATDVFFTVVLLVAVAVVLFPVLVAVDTFEVATRLVAGVVPLAVVYEIFFILKEKKTCN